MFEEKKLRALLQTLTINDKYGRLKTSKGELNKCHGDGLMDVQLK